MVSGGKFVLYSSALFCSEFHHNLTLTGVSCSKLPSPKSIISDLVIIGTTLFIVGLSVYIIISEHRAIIKKHNSIITKTRVEVSGFIVIFSS